MKTECPKKQPYSIVTGWFAEHMRRRLVAHRARGSSWRDEQYRYLMRRWQDEVVELNLAIERNQGGRAGDDLTESKAIHVIHEAADVANFAMMIADKMCPYAEEEKLHGD